MKPLARLALAVFSVGILVACASEEDADGSAGAATTESAASEAILEGLVAEPGSKARIKAGELLEAKLSESYAKFKTSRAEPEEQALAKKIFGFTVEYLKSPDKAGCPADKKIRLYRGFGPQLMLHPKGQPSRRLHLFGEWGSRIREDMKAALDASKDPGEVAFEQRASFKKAALDALPWDELLGKREIYDHRGNAEEVDLKWSALARSHTVGGSVTPLLSMSMEADISERFGPGYIVADVCPERAIPFNGSDDYFNELEVYVPFFLLPEEIVRVEGQDCGLDVARKVAQEKDEAKKPDVKRSARKACYPGDFTDDAAARSPTGQTYRACYSNFGFRSEHGIESAGIGPLSERFSNKTKDALYNVLVKSTTIADVRRNAAGAELAKTCAPDCKTAATILSDVEKQIAAGSSTSNLAKIAQDLPGYRDAVTKACPP